MITYAPLIKFVEDYNSWFHDKFANTSTDNWSSSQVEEHERWKQVRESIKGEILARFEYEAREKFGVRGVYTDAVDCLTVERVSGPFIVKEWEGEESLMELDLEEQVHLPLPDDR